MKAGSKMMGDRVPPFVEDPGSSHTWTLHLNFLAMGINKFLFLLKKSHFELGVLLLVTKWALLYLICLCCTWGRIQVNPLEMSCMIKSGSLSDYEGRCKRLLEDKSSQGKGGKETAKDGHFLNESEDHRDIVNFPSSFDISPSHHQITLLQCWEKVLAKIVMC